MSRDAESPQCIRCEDTYVSYEYLVKNRLPPAGMRLPNENLCKPCRAAVYPEQLFRGKQDTTPKTDGDLGTDADGYVER